MKILYIDTETTGINPQRNAIIQLAGAIEIDGVIVESFNLTMRPPDDTEIDPKALEVNHRAYEEIIAYEDPVAQHSVFTALLGKHCDKFNRADKFYVAGYNVRFDVEFLAAFFRRCNDQYLGSWINWHMIDPLPVLHYLEYAGKIRLDDYKLGTVCKHFGISLDAHDALNDILATRQVIQRLGNVFADLKTVE